MGDTRGGSPGAAAACTKRHLRRAKQRLMLAPGSVELETEPISSSLPRIRNWFLSRRPDNATAQSSARSARQGVSATPSSTPGDPAGDADIDYVVLHVGYTASKWRFSFS